MRAVQNPSFRADDAPISREQRTHTMSRQPPVSSRPNRRAPARGKPTATDVPVAPVPPSVPTPRAASSDMERALPHPRSSVESQARTDGDSADVKGFLEPGPPAGSAT